MSPIRTWVLLFAMAMMAFAVPVSSQEPVPGLNYVHYPEEALVIESSVGGIRLGFACREGGPVVLHWRDDRLGDQLPGRIRAIHFQSPYGGQLQILPSPPWQPWSESPLTETHGNGSWLAMTGQAAVEFWNRALPDGALPPDVDRVIPRLTGTTVRGGPLRKQHSPITPAIFDVLDCLGR